MILLFDTNVALNALLKREDPYLNESVMLLQKCNEGIVKGYIALHSVSIIWYILRKVYGDEDARTLLYDFCNIMHIVSIERDEVLSCIQRSEFKDFEDCLQDACACHVSTDYLVTCNTKDFEHAHSKVVNPRVMLELLDKDQPQSL